MSTCPTCGLAVRRYYEQQIEALKQAESEVTRLRTALQRIILISPRCDACSATHNVVATAEAALVS